MPLVNCAVCSWCYSRDGRGTLWTLPHLNDDTTLHLSRVVLWGVSPLFEPSDHYPCRYLSITYIFLADYNSVYYFAVAFKTWIRSSSAWWMSWKQPTRTPHNCSFISVWPCSLASLSYFSMPERNTFLVRRKFVLMRLLYFSISHPLYF